jgi:hypothetical protein
MDGTAAALGACTLLVTGVLAVCVEGVEDVPPSGACMTLSATSVANGSDNGILDDR